jgi:hypothetical protein
MKNIFEKLNEVKKYKFRNHYTFNKTTWIIDNCVYKKYIVTNLYQLDKFKDSFKVYQSLNKKFCFEVDNNIIYVKADKINNENIDYSDFLLKIESYLLANFSKNNLFLCFEDIGRHNYFVNNNQVSLIDESKLSICNNFETFYIKIVHSLVDGYKNEIEHLGLVPNVEYEKIIYKIVNKIKN